MLTPRKPVPDFTVPLLNGGTWTLSEQTPENFSLIIFYRGLHCAFLCDVCRRFHPQDTSRCLVRYHYGHTVRCF